MNIQKYIEEMEKLQSGTIDFIDNEDDVEESFQNHKNVKWFISYISYTLKFSPCAIMYTKRALGCGLVVECLTSMQEALGLVPLTAKIQL